MEKSIKNSEVQESGVIKKQSVEGLYITGYEWCDYVDIEDVITYFVLNGIIKRPYGEYDEDKIIDDIITNHRNEYIEYIDDLRQIYEMIDYL